MREQDAVVLADTCAVKQVAAADAAVDAVDAVDAEAGGFVVQMYSWNIAVVVVVIELAWQQLLVDCRLGDLVDTRNLAVAQLDDGCAGLEAYLEVRFD
jgi:hypothetical protein